VGQGEKRQWLTFRTSGLEVRFLKRVRRLYVVICNYSTRAAQAEFPLHSALDVFAKDLLK
jgi:hypothetical protein